MERLAADEFDDRPLGMDLVFRDAVGRPFSPFVVSQMFTKEWTHAGFRPGVNLQSRRHSMASMLVADGFPLTEVAGRLGHTVDVLQRVYARDLDPVSREERMVEAITSHFGK